LKLLHATYKADLIGALTDHIIRDNAAAERKTANEWSQFLKAVQADESKAIKDALKSLLRAKQGVVSRIPQRRGD
jgi:hypothetical protein